MIRPLAAMWRASILAATQYRGNFIAGAAVSACWSLWSVIPLFFVFTHTDNVAGWTYPQALLVMSFYMLLRALLDGFIDPNLRHLVAQVRDGTLDFVLLKPADPQILVSFARLEPARFLDILGAMGVGIWCLVEIGRFPSLFEIVAATICLLAGLAIVYSLWLMAAASAFWWVRVDSLSFLLGAMLDAGRWPSIVYRGWLRVVLTFVLPVALMTTYPAMALLGMLDLGSIAMAVGVAMVFVVVARLLWKNALSHYASASS